MDILGVADVVVLVVLVDVCRDEHLVNAGLKRVYLIFIQLKRNIANLFVAIVCLC